MSGLLIVGATSAIAQATARRLAARGDRLFLAARDAARLRALAAELGDAVIGTAPFVAEDTAAHAGLVDAAAEALGGLDAVLVAHGLLGDQLASEADFAIADAILRTNLNDTVALLIPVANRLERQGQGTLAVITSVAADRGRPRNYTYGAAKGALNVYLQGLRTRLGPAVQVVTLKVGPTDSPMTEGHPRNALFATPDEVARGIERALDRGAGTYYVPPRWRPLMAIIRRLPERVFRGVPVLGGR